jgi:3-hydroxymyristoyl/3-hydroxydecanoyl-(acyl carrier protein) dehydratase
MHKELLNTLISNDITNDMGNEMFDKLEKMWPKFISSKEDKDTLTLSLDISEDIHWFAGHFPNKAVLPGVAQLHWAAELATCIAGHLGSFKAASNVKFKKMILPNEKVDLVLVVNAVKKTVAFTYKYKSDVFSSGSLLFEFK